MLKNGSILLYLVIVNALSFTNQLCAQATQNQVQTTESLTLVKQNGSVNNFENLVTPKQIVYQLQKNYGIKGSIILTEALVHILNSYSNQQQAQNIWQSAINKVTELQHRSTNPRLNARFNIGQILSTYTHGMTLVSWNKNRSGFKMRASDLAKVFDANDDVTLYFNLDKIWKQLLNDLANKENIQWNDVFFNSLDLFSQANGLTQTIKQTQEPEDQEEIRVEIFNAILSWEQSGVDAELAEIVSLMNALDQGSAYLYQRMIALILEKRSQNLISVSLAWFAVAEQLYVLKPIFSQQELAAVSQLIEKNDAWFLANENALIMVDKKLPQWVEKSFHDLKKHYADSNILVDFSASLTSVFQMQGNQLKKYMATPFRQKIQTQLEVCLNISEEFMPLPQLPIDVNQFNGCINDMVRAATIEAGSRELAGSLTKVNSDQALKRALQLPPWQIINILYAHVAEESCLDDTTPLVNPLEWALTSETLLWFADRWPAYMRQYPQTNLIDKVIKQGQRLSSGLSCLEDSPQNILNVRFKQIAQAWQNVRTQIQNVVNEFEVDNLSEGSDIDLLESSGSDSHFGIENYKIEACNAQSSCGVHVKLESSKALFGLFPNHLLEAHQLQLGELKLCYDSVGWVNRRSSATHLDNDSVANYFGNFSFSLKGFYNDKLVFERKLIDSQEYHYLFAENSEDVLNTVCPLPIVGSKISTQLKRGTYGLVPNRLTFLTASRANESDILLSNWAHGEEWKDKILSSDVQVLVDNSLNELKNEIQQAYQLKAAQLQEIIYKTLLNTLTQPSNAQQQLSDAFAKMQLNTKMFYALSYIFRMDDVLVNDKFHGIFFGEDKLADYVTMAGYYRNQLNIKLLLSSVDANLNLNQQKWNSLEQAMSYSHIKNILYQLKSLNL
jgi:hypothetical protein